MKNFDEYFTRTWISGEYYSITDWNQHADFKRRTNNWSEAFNSSFSKRFCKSHPNIYILANVLKDVCLYNQFIFNDYIKRPIHNVNKQFIDFNDELEKILDQKQTTYKNLQKDYLIAISNIQIKIYLKYERDLLQENKMNEKRVQEIDDILNNRKEMSLICDIDDINEKEEKLKIITKTYRTKRLKQLKEKIPRIEEGKKDKKDKRRILIHRK